MATKMLLLLAAVALLVASSGAWEINIHMPTSVATVTAMEEAMAPIIHALRPMLGSGGQLGSRAGVACDSWRLGVEAHNVRDWKTAISYVDSLKLAGNGKEVWVFDVDETTLSNLPYYATHGFGATPYNWTSFQEYARQASAPALPETKRLFDKLLSVGIKPVILTGRREVQRTATVTNLRRQGFSGWMTVLLKPAEFKGSGVTFKSGERQKLLDAGYVIVGNIGDQWSDILGVDEPASILIGLRPGTPLRATIGV
uniref:Acid phosphatase 1 n=1 Tax=Aegilops tauschii subsp. strangulata TaxID=200361 RepID=A0A453QF47_AEGTS